MPETPVACWGHPRTSQDVRSRRLIPGSTGSRSDCSFALSFRYGVARTGPKERTTPARSMNIALPMVQRKIRFSDRRVRASSCIFLRFRASRSFDLYTIIVRAILCT